jgi:D-alanyl-D-alanine carboxypeptidase
MIFPDKHPMNKCVSIENCLNIKLRFVLIAILALISRESIGDDIDNYVKTQMERRHIPGLSLAIVKEGAVIKSKGYGLANVETDTPATPESVYKIGSVSKQFLAAGIMLLVQDGKMGLSDKVSKYLDDTPEAWKDITVHHLLTHTSGLVEDPPNFEPFKVQPDIDVIKLAYSTSLIFPPGEKWSYSNLGYFVLAEIIHKVSGVAWSTFITQRIFTPAQMTATKTTTTTDIVPHRAAGYAWNNHKLENAENWVAVRPSGAFLSTVLDMARWDALLYTNTILSIEVREQMWTPVKLNGGATYPYGFGWSLEPWLGHKRAHHNGSLPGFLCDFERFMDDRLTVIVFINGTSGDPAKIARNIAGIYTPALALKPIADGDPEITTKVKTLIDGFVGGNLDTNLFTFELNSWLSDGGKVGMSNAFRSPGAIKSVSLVERKNEGDTRTYRYLVTYPTENLLGTFEFNMDNKVTSFGIEPE